MGIINFYFPNAILSVYRYLQFLLLCTSTKRKFLQASTVRLSVSPLQANEVAVIRKRCHAFDVKQHEFRENFRRYEVLLFLFFVLHPINYVETCICRCG